MHEQREHWIGDQVVDLCWADRAGPSDNQTPCNRTNVGRLGLCPMHEDEILRVPTLPTPTPLNGFVVGTDGVAIAAQVDEAA